MVNKDIEYLAGIMCDEAYHINGRIQTIDEWLLDVESEQMKYYSIYGIRVGRICGEDVWDYDLYSEIAQYDKKVLLLHGDRGDIVDISCSERAVEVYPNEELRVIEDAGHMFMGGSVSQALVYIFDYLQEIGVIK